MDDNMQAPAVNDVAPPTAPNLPPPAAPMPQQAAPEKPSLWKNVLAGALQGLAGSAGASSFGAGLARGAGGQMAAQQQALENQRAQQQQMSQEQTEQFRRANLQAETMKTMAEFHNLPPSWQDAQSEKLADTAAAQIKAGIYVPQGPAVDSVDKATDQAHELFKKDPSKLYTVVPVRGEKGALMYQVMDSPSSPTQADVTVELPGGGKRVIPAGSMRGSDVAALNLASVKQSIADASTKPKGGQPKTIQVMGPDGKPHVMAYNEKSGKYDADQGLAVPKGTGDKPGALLFGSLPDGTQVAGNEEQLKQWGAQGVAKLPADETKKAALARELISPPGLFNQVHNDIATLEKAGKLGVVASRWSDFMAGKVGSEPDFAKLRTDMGLLATALMQAHVGARGSNEMLEHFRSLADYRISDPATLKAALGQEWHYVHSKAMLPPQGLTGGK